MGANTIHDLIGGAASLAVVIGAVPLAIWILGFARRHRAPSAVFGGVLLIFGLSAQVSAPPPPQVEAIEHEEADAGDDEPK